MYNIVGRLSNTILIISKLEQQIFDIGAVRSEVFCSLGGGNPRDGQSLNIDGDEKFVHRDRSLSIC
jgi:hypothetical protein